jgi:hypothetical protein
MLVRTDNEDFCRFFVRRVMAYDGGELDQAWTQPVTLVLPRTTAGRALNPLQRLGKFWEELVGVSGFEPPAPASRTQCSTRLSYTPTVGRAL